MTFLVAALLSVGASARLSQYLGRASVLDANQTIIDSFFFNHYDRYGGAVEFDSQGTLAICTTTFLLCGAECGGAIEIYKANAICSFCCFSRTNASVYGTAIDLWSGPVGSVINDTNFVSCRDVSSFQPAKGTIADSTSAFHNFHRLNFTACGLQQNSSGMVLYHHQVDADTVGIGWNFSECTVLQCVGSTGIEISIAIRLIPAVSRCNFYENRVSNAFLYAFGIRVEGCIFRDNDKDIARPSLPTTGRFAVLNCVFSDSLPSESDCDVMTGNVGNQATASLYLVHFSTFYCPVATPLVVPPTLTHSRSRSPTASRNCNRTSGGERILRESGCLEVTNSFFSGLDADDQNGGAILARESDLFVLDSTFYFCSASRGGAIDYGQSRIELIRSCFASTSAPVEGAAVNIWQCDGGFNLRQCIFVGCSGQDQCQGTVCVDAPSPPCTAEILNFSRCSLPKSEIGRGFAFLFRSSASDFGLQFCGIDSCAGSTGIETDSSLKPAIESCNFYGNDASLSVLFGRTAGMRLKNCIFNSNFRDLGMQTPAAANGFDILNCVFSGAQPAGSIISVTADNKWNTQTAANVIGPFDGVQCVRSGATPHPPRSPRPTLSRTPTASRDCVLYSRPTRIWYSSGCAEVRDTVFRGFDNSNSRSDTFGGAIQVDPGATGLYVLDTAFQNCRSGLGGAVNSDADQSELVRCCFRATAAKSRGAAFYADAPHSKTLLADSSFSECRDIKSCWGTIYDKLLFEATYERLNITKCEISSYGAALALETSSSPTVLVSYCTMSDCTGRSILDTVDLYPRVEYCNVIGNTATSSYNVFGGLYRGMEVDGCIFVGNSAEFALFGTGGQKFTISNCVFDGDFPAGSFCEASAGNSVRTSTASYAIEFFVTHYCPGMTRSPTATPEIWATLIATPSPPVSATPEETPGPSLTPATSPLASDSPAATPTDSPSPSRDCQIYAGISSFIVDERWTGCVEIIGSVFFGLESTQGGAI
jgi:hypothetical protein